MKQTAEERKEKARVRSRAWHQANKEKANTASKERHAANREKENAACKALYHAKKADRLAAMKAHRDANKEKINAHRKELTLLRRQEHLEKRRAYLEKYRLENMHVILAACAKRRAKKRKQTPAWCNDKDCILVYSKCPLGFHVDHIVPLQGELVSGLHWAHNLQYLPASENISKSNKFDPDTYVHELPATMPQ